jgi:hypothetical protein
MTYVHARVSEVCVHVPALVSSEDVSLDGTTAATGGACDAMEYVVTCTCTSGRCHVLHGVTWSDTCGRAMPPS